MRRVLVAACVALSLGLVAVRGASAQSELADLKYTTKVDLPIAIGGAVAWLGSEFVLKATLAPASCRFCDPPAIDQAVRDALKWDNTTLPDTLSGILGFGVLPALLAGADALMANHDKAIHDFGPDVLIIAETTVIAMDVNQLVKFIVGRQRPFVHALAPGGRKCKTACDDDNLSFFSGHTTGAFALAVATGTVASMRHYRWAPIAWTVGPVLAVTTGYLRIAADKHYFTDVLTGAVVGSAFGFALPYCLHAAHSDRTGAATGMLRTNTLLLSGVW